MTTMALCLSGDSYGYDTAFPWVFEYLIKPWKPSIYYHTWEAESNNHLKALYRPHKCIVEKKKSFPTSSYEATALPNVDIEDTLQQLYSTSRVMDAMYHQIRTEQVMYDWVVKLSFGIAPDQDIPFDTFNTDYIAVPDNNTHPYGFNTKMAIGTSGKLLLYGSLFSSLTTVHNVRREFKDEILLHQFANMTKLKIKPYPIFYRDFG